MDECMGGRQEKQWPELCSIFPGASIRWHCCISLRTAGLSGYSKLSLCSPGRCVGVCMMGGGGGDQPSWIVPFQAGTRVNNTVEQLYKLGRNIYSTQL